MGIPAHILELTHGLESPYHLSVLSALSVDKANNKQEVILGEAVSLCGISI